MPCFLLSYAPFLFAEQHGRAVNRFIADNGYEHINQFDSVMLVLSAHYQLEAVHCLYVDPEIIPNSLIHLSINSLIDNDYLEPGK